MYADILRKHFPDLNPVVDDLLLLEAHQVADLAARVPGPELAVLLHAHPRIVRYLTVRWPPIEPTLIGLLEAHAPQPAALARSAEVLWEIADWIVYQRAPETYEAGSGVAWHPDAVTEGMSAGGVVIDAGAGTGRVAFAVAPLAQVVFAVEPVAALRRYMRAEATRRGVDNLYVVDGFLDAIPLPPASADVLLTCQAIGWSLEAELREIERVVKPGGQAMHVFGTATTGNALEQDLVRTGHTLDPFDREGVQMRRYRRRFTP